MAVDQSVEELLGSEPADQLWRAGELLPLGTMVGEASPAAVRNGPGRVYGLRHAVQPRPEEHGTVVNPVRLMLCPVRQIALSDGEPLHRTPAHTNGKTKIPYDTDTGQDRRTDYNEDVTDD